MRLHLASESATGYKNVCEQSSGRFRAKHRVNKKLVDLGTYDTALEAAVAYARAVGAAQPTSKGDIDVTAEVTVSPAAAEVAPPAEVTPAGGAAALPAIHASAQAGADPSATGAALAAAADLVAADTRLRKAEGDLVAATGWLRKAAGASAAAQRRLEGRKHDSKECRAADAANDEAQAREQVQRLTAALAEARRASRRVRAASPVPPHHSLRHE